MQTQGEHAKLHIENNLKESQYQAKDLGGIATL